MKKLLFLAALCVSTSALAQNSPSGAPRVQGVPDGYGDPVQVTIVGATGAGSSADVVATGNVASAATDSGNPVKVGCKYNAASPTFTDGQRADLQCGSLGQLYVSVFGSGGLVGTATGADDETNATAAMRVSARLQGYDGTTWDRMRGDANGLVVLPGLASTYWSYANGATGILSNTTTAVTIKTAAGASVRNFIDSCTINTTAFGAAVPLVIRDGAAGTIIWSQTVPTAGWLTPVNIQFRMPLRGTANTLLEIATPTANTSGTVYVSCQGHTGP